MQPIFKDRLENQAKTGLKERWSAVKVFQLNGHFMNRLPHVRVGGFHCAVQPIFKDRLENQAKTGLKERWSTVKVFQLNGHVRVGGFHCAAQPIFKDSPKSQAQAVLKVGCPWSGHLHGRFTRKVSEKKK